MTIYRVTPTNGVPVLRASRSIDRATARGLVEFPGGLASVEAVPVEELAAMVADGLSIPMAGRQAVAVFNAVKREKERARRAKERKQAEAAAKKEEAKEAAREAAAKARQVAREARARERASAARKVKAAATRAAAKSVPVHTPSAATPVSVAPPELQHLDDGPWEEGAAPW